MIRCGASLLRTLNEGVRREWLDTNGRGGFASSTVIGLNTRRYHALLVAAPPDIATRLVLLAKLEETVTVGGVHYDLGVNEYVGGVHPRGFEHQTEFRLDPFPMFSYAVPGAVLEKAVFMVHGEDTTVVQYTLRAARVGPVRLEVRPLVAFRDYHGLTRENAALDPAITVGSGWFSLTPYPGLPTLWLAHTAATLEPQGVWYRDFLYRAERARGLDCVEDLFDPCAIQFELAGAGATAALVASTALRSAEAVDAYVAAERQRRAAVTVSVPADVRVRALERAAEHYLVESHGRRSIIAGYPWFGEWGRDTFIALRGLCLGRGRFDVAGEILRSWAGTVSAGQVPNCFPDSTTEPAYNAVDASLWFVVVVGEYLATAPDVGDDERRLLRGAVDAILEGYAAGTRFGIGLDDDGLIRAGVPGVQLTWMDAKVDDWVVTPRAGKPVEIEALWVNALDVGAMWAPRWVALRDRALGTFAERFWNERDSCLYDVVDVDGQRGSVDARFRPNQIFAVGGLPRRLLARSRARQVVSAVEAKLWTPLGLRSLAPGESGYAPRYAGDVRERDGAYHQGTAWPWLLGAFVDAWLWVRGNTDEARAEARHRFLEPLLRHVEDAGLGHISEVADGDRPHTPGGCPFQAWSVGEALRLLHVVLPSPAA